MHYIHEEIGIPKITSQDIEKNDVVFTMSPLPQGYGTTLGNSLRRVLLSSLPGSAVTGVKIKGVSHEYTTIPGIKETVLDILLNFKQLRVKKDSREPSFLKLKVSGEREVTAADIQAPTGVTILNPDLHLATLTEKKAELDMDIRVEKGVGYVPISELKKEEHDTNMILIDASFSPVLHVRFDVTAARVGQKTNLDKLEMEIKTDSSITPKDALLFAADMLKSYFSLFNKEGVLIEKDFMSDPDQILQKEQEEKAKEESKESYTPIEVLNLSPRTLNALINGNIGSIEQLVKCTESKLNNLRGFGKKAMSEIKTALKERNLKLLGDD
jgi:DNA-directed RNA polymerase subunit alpha